MRIDAAHSIADLERLARRRMPRFLHDFVAGGAGDETTLAANREGFRSRRLLPRMLTAGGEPSPEVMLAGKPTALPMAIAPIGLAGLMHPDGEIGLARAAAGAGVPFCLSTNAVASLEQVARAVPEGRLWFQLYPLKDRAMMAALLDRAAASGAEALVLTVDLPVQGRRRRDLRNGFSVPPRPTLATALDLAWHPRWAIGALRGPRIGFGNLDTTPARNAVSIARHVGTLFDQHFSWDDAARVRDDWRGQFIVKGILAPDDGTRAAAIGADAIVVSNHGGRQLDGAIAAIDALPAVVAAVADRVPVLMDGGVRSGTDVLIAQSLGATACLVGRAVLWGLAAGGQAGAERAFTILREELMNSLALLGVGGNFSAAERRHAV